MTEIIQTINSWAWGPVMLVLLLGTGLLTVAGEDRPDLSVVT